MRVEQTNGVLPDRCRDHTEVNEVEVDTQVAARGCQSARLGTDERGPGGARVASQYEPNVRRRVGLQTGQRITVRMAKREGVIIRAHPRAETDGGPDS